MVKINNLHADIEGQPILKGLDLELIPGKIHVIMGPNGAGKSTLAKVLAGHPSYTVEEGTCEVSGENILECEPEERVKKGLYMSFQYPLEILGCSNFDFLFTIKNSDRAAKGLPKLTEQEFRKELDMHLDVMQMKPEFLQRDINVGFSGGEKKKNEILQLAILDPRIAILDETDSGLDIDAMRIVAEGVKRWMQPDKCLLVITHYQRLLQYLQPDSIHVMIDGKIVKTSDASLAQELESKGYDWLIEETVGV
jgi:Fe-S cluster assembly ATP-binding protein